MALPTQLMADPARNAEMSGRARDRQDADGRASRKDDRDFGSVMSDGAKAPTRQSRPAAKSGDSRESPADASARDATPTDAAPDAASKNKPGKTPADVGTDSAADARDGDMPDAAAAETPRRQVTIPDLPAGRGPAAARTQASMDNTVPVHPNGDAARVAETSPVDAESTVESGQARTPTGSSQAPAAAAGQPFAPGQSAATIQPGPAPVPAASMPTDSVDPETGRIAEGVRAAGADMPRTATVPAAGIAQVVQAQAQAQKQPRSAPHPADNSRADPRAHDLIARTDASAPTAPATPPLVAMAQASVAAQPAALAPLTHAAAAAKEKSEALLSLDGEADTLRFDLRGASTSGNPQQTGAMAGMGRSDVARGVAVQIADMMRAMPDRPIDVSLSPQELGRVRLSISTGEGGVTLHVLAERPETLDLMRRHADMLARELADLGFTSIDLAFGGGKNPEAGEDEAGTDPAASGGAAQAREDTDTPTDAQAPPDNRIMLGPNGGLDIRI